MTITMLMLVRLLLLLSPSRIPTRALIEPIIMRIFNCSALLWLLFCFEQITRQTGSSIRSQRNVVEASGVVAHDLLLLFNGVLLDVILNDGEDLVVGSGDGADGPVGTHHDSVRAESVKDHVQVLGEVGLLPVLPVVLRDHTTDLDHDVGVAGELLSR